MRTSASPFGGPRGQLRTHSVLTLAHPNQTTAPAAPCPASPSGHPPGRTGPLPPTAHACCGCHVSVICWAPVPPRLPAAQGQAWDFLSAPTNEPLMGRLSSSETERSSKPEPRAQRLGVCCRESAAGPTQGHPTQGRGGPAQGTPPRAAPPSPAFD